MKVYGIKALKIWTEQSYDENNQVTPSGRLPVNSR